MARRRTRTPYKCQVFVCVNDRKGEKVSCADGNSQDIRIKLKKAVKERWGPQEVRVSQSLCMDICELGPNVIIYPQQVWFSQVTMDDIDRILEEIAQIVES